jgi:hypothetical protein
MLLEELVDSHGSEGLLEDFKVFMRKFFCPARKI